MLWLEEHEQLSPSEIATALEQKSGLLALAGSADMRQVEAAAEDGNPDAVLALDVYVHRLTAGIAMTAAIGGLDALVFTRGVGESSPTVRQRACENLGFLGLTIDPARVQLNDDRDISTAGTAIRALVFEAREDLEIARDTRKLLS